MTEIANLLRRADVASAAAKVRPGATEAEITRIVEAVDLDSAERSVLIRELASMAQQKLVYRRSVDID